jgi:hypothetical protein
MNRRLIIVSVSLTIGGVLAGVGLTANGALASSNSSQAPTSPNPAYSVNSQGETYGPALDGVPQLQLPDLVPVTATNGVSGYVKETDLVGPSPTLQQVLKFPRDSQGNFVGPSTPSLLPVYASDGTTQIGVIANG